MHNYQLMQQTRMTRKMDHCRLIDETHLPQKNFAAVDSNKETISEFQCKGQALKVPRPKGKPKSMTCWKLPSIYGGDSIVSSQVFPH